MEGLNIYDVLDRIAAPFKGVDDEYVKLIRTYHAAFISDRFTDEHKTKVRAQTVNGIYDLVADRVRAAKKVIEEIRAEYTPSPAALPKLSDTGRLYNLTLWREVLPYATVDELREMYLEYGSEPDFMRLLTVEFRKREDEDEVTDMTLQVLRHEIEEGPEVEGFDDLDRIVKALNMFVSAARETFPEDLPGIIESNLDTTKVRTVRADLAAFPIDDHATFRPLFKLGVQT